MTNEPPDIPEAKAELLREALGKSEDELYADLGEMSSLGTVRLPFQNLVLRGQEWFEDHLDQIRDALCKSAGVRRNLDTTQFDLIVSALAALELAFGQAMTLVPVAALTVKVGIKDLCKDTWEVNEART